MELAKVVVDVCETERAQGASNFKFLYELEGTSVKEKIETIAKEVY